MQHHQNWDAFRNRILKLFVGVAETVFRDSSVPSSNNENIVVTLIDERLNELKLIIVDCGERLHLHRKIAGTYYYVLNGPPLILEVHKRRAYEDLISFFLHAESHDNLDDIPFSPLSQGVTSWWIFARRWKVGRSPAHIEFVVIAHAGHYSTNVMIGKDPGDTLLMNFVAWEWVSDYLVKEDAMAISQVVGYLN